MNPTPILLTPMPVMTGRSSNQLSALVLDKGITADSMDKLQHLIEDNLETTNRSVSFIGIFDDQALTMHTSEAVVAAIEGQTLRCPTLEDVLVFVALVGVDQALKVINEALSLVRKDAIIQQKNTEAIAVVCELAEPGQKAVVTITRSTLTISPFDESQHWVRSTMFLAVTYEA